MSTHTDLTQRENARRELLEHINTEASSQRYIIEDLATEAIANGDQELLQQALDKIDMDNYVQHIENISAESELRTYKNVLLSNNTYCRLAAKNGDVLPLYLYLLSEQYHHLIESADSIEFLMENIFFQMPRDYCEFVHKYSITSYSNTMKEIIKFVTDHLTVDLTLKDIAEKFDMHPVHLARKFKQETGITYVSYMNNQRIFLAQYLFHLQTYELSDVAYLAGFNSHSYFTKVFKKITGLTPTKYIKQLPL